MNPAPSTTRNEPARCPRTLVRALPALLLALAAGCGGQEQPPLAEYLNRLELDVPLQSKAYVELGEFDVPVTIKSLRPKKPKKKLPAPVRMRLRFTLSAETDPQRDAALTAAYQQRRGALNDAIITIIRHSSADDLADPRLAAIKTRVLDAVQPMLGDEAIRQLVFTDIRTESL